MYIEITGYEKNVLRETKKGRKRNLSLYKSRNAKKRKTEECQDMSNCEESKIETPSESESNSFIDQTDNPNMHAVGIVPESDLDICVEVKHCDSSISEKDYETLNSTEENAESETLAHDSTSESDVDEGKTF